MLLLLQAFSISQIATAYCDEGQNYKNLVGYVKGLSKCCYHAWENIKSCFTDVKFEMDVRFGCKEE